MKVLGWGGRHFEIVSTSQNVKLPIRKTRHSAGYDLSAEKQVTIPAGALALVPTGIKAYMQPDEVLMLHIRSSLAVKKHLILANGVGVIDADYYNNPDNEGHIQIALFNTGLEPVIIEKGERIAQALFLKYLLTDDDSLENGEDRAGGFGSTGS